MVLSMSVTDFGDVIAIFLPTRSLTDLIGESGMVTQYTSAAERTAPMTILMSAPSWIAAMAAESATSPNGRPPSSTLRTVVPPPFEVRMPVTSMPASLKKPFFMATA